MALPEGEADKVELAQLGVYNIWYHHTSGAGRSTVKRAHDAWTKILPAVCRTRGDAELARLQAGSSVPTAASAQVRVCLDFARGACSRGRECERLHRVPTDADEARMSRDNMHDVFGRSRHALHKDDMSGTGSFFADNRTLYVGRVKTLPGEETKARLVTVFGLWGPLVSVRFIESKSIAFIQYRNRTSAEFAKEAMDDQCAFEGDTEARFNMRWSIETEAIKKSRTEDRKRQAEDVIREAMDPTILALQQPLKGVPGGEEAEALGNYPDTDAQYQQDDGEAYPDTDAQFAITAPAAKKQRTEHQQEADRGKSDGDDDDDGKGALGLLADYGDD
jgi:hypothetical protein